MNDPSCKHPGIERAEGNYFWCIPCHRWIGNNSYPRYLAPIDDAIVELTFDRDTESYQYPEDVY
jgi:hypothetical protein